MCRLFGLRADEPHSVHQSLVRAQNSLRQQSHEHKDGWGIAYYPSKGSPQRLFGLDPAHADPEFERHSTLVSSHAVLAHVRFATVGAVSRLNAHPFSCGEWTFVHNGTLRGFAVHRPEIESHIDPAYRAELKGDTDSERCFYLFLTFLDHEAAERPVTAREVGRALARTARLAREVTKPSETLKPTAVTMIATNGRLMVAARHHRTLFFTDGRRSAPGIVPPAPGTRVNKLLIASEMLCPHEAWHEIPEEGVVALEEDLTFRTWSFNELVA